MHFIDINTFYSARGGGIRTYHEAKLAWFAGQTQHSYCLVCPGARRHDEHRWANVQVCEVWGPSVGQGYRLMADYLSVWRIIQTQQPEVLEIGDATPSGLVYWLSRKLWRRSPETRPRLVTSFYHSDLVRTSIAPWAEAPGLLRPLRQTAAMLASRFFYRHQKSYDRTIVTSRAMQAHLATQGIERTARLPLGVDPVFFSACDRQPRSGQPVRLLFAGRLGKEKGIELLLDVLPRLLARDDVTLTVVGKGAHEAAFAAIDHPRYRFHPFVRERAEMAEIYRQHDILLAPGPYETFGLGVLEALAGGMVVVGPNAGGVGELLGELNSDYAFKAHDAEAFYAAICRAAVCDLEFEASRSREVARCYGTWSDAIARMVEFYESELMQRGRRATLTGPHVPRQRAAIDRFQKTS